MTIPFSSATFCVLVFAVSGCAAPGPVVLSPAHDDGSTLVEFVAGSSDEWVLERENGETICALPCAYRVERGSHLHVRLFNPKESRVQAAAAEDGVKPAPISLYATWDATSFEVPDAFPGPTVRMTVDRMHGLGPVGKVLAVMVGAPVGLAGAIATTVGAVRLANGSPDYYSTTSTTTGAPPQQTLVHGSTADDAAVVGFGVGLLAASALCWVWFAHDRGASSHIEVLDHVSIDPRPGALEITSPRVKASVTPFGLSGSF